MSTVDPNIYALKVQMSLDSGDAFNTLDQFSDSVSKVEEQVSAAASEALKSIEDVAKGLDASLGSVESAANGIELTSRGIEANFAAVASVMSDMGTLSNEELVTAEKMVDTLQEMLDLEEDIHRVSGDEHDVRKDHLGTNEDIIDALKSKNKLHDEEIKKVSFEEKLARKLRKTFGEFGESVERSYEAVSFLANKFKDIMNVIAKATEIQEKFVENNYRAYGSMEGIAQQTRQIATQQGVLEENSVAAYKALADVRTPREEIGKYTKQVVMMNRVTGTSITTLAEYSRKLRAAGGDASSGELAFGRAQEAMRKFGTSAEAMNKILGDSTVTTTDLTIMFGKMGQADFTTLNAQMAGLAESIGISADVARNQLNFLANDMIGSMKMADAAGMGAINSVRDMEEAMVGAGAAFQDQYDRIEASTAAPAEKKREMEIIAESMGFVDTEAAKLGMEMARLRDEMGEEASFDQIMAKAQKNLENSWTATQRFNHALKDLYDNIGLVFNNFLSLIGIVLVPMIKWLATFVGWIATAVGWITQFYDWLRNLWIIGPIIKLFESFVGFLMALGLTIAFVTAAVALSSSALLSFGTAWAFAGTVMTSTAGMILPIAGAIGRAIITVFRSIGIALAKLGELVAPVMMPLLALGAAFMMVGLGAYFFAQAMVTLSDVSWGGIAAGLVMVGVAIALIIAATYILAASAPVAAAAVPILWAIGAAMLMIGGAAWLMGAGLKLAAEAFMMIVDAIGPHSPPLWVKLPMVAAGLIAVAIAAIYSAPGLIILATTMTVVALAAWLLGGALYTIASAVKGLSGEAIAEFASGLLSASWKITLAVAALAPAILLVVWLAPGLITAGTILIVAGTLFGVAGMLIGYGAKMLGAGLQSLGPGAKALADVDFIWMAVQLAIGGGLLASGGAAFVVGATLVGVGALLLGLGLQSLGPGAKALADVDFISMAAQLMVGGFWLNIGGAAFVVGATLVGVGALLLGLGLLSLGKGAQQLKDIDFSEMSADLAMAGIFLLLAATPLMLGSLAMASSGKYILIAGMLIGAGGVMMAKGAAGIKSGADDLYSSSDKLLCSGVALIKAGPLLAYGSMAMIVASFKLIKAAVMLNVAGNWLVPASQSIYFSIWWLVSALERFRKSIPTIEKMGDAVLKLATAFAIMKTTPFHSMEEAAEVGLNAIPKLDQLAKQLPPIAAHLSTASAKFAKPVDKLAEVLTNLGDAISKFDGVGQNLANEMEQVANVLDEYAFRLEAASQRIQTAVDAKAVPAITAADNAGIDDIVKSEAITQVQVTTESEGKEKEDDQLVLLAAQVALLKGVDEKLLALTGGGTEMVTILELLQSYLPQLIEKDAGLASEMNQWMK